MVLVIQPPPIRGLSQTGGFEFMIEDRDGRGVEALAMVTDRFLEAQGRRQAGIPSWPPCSPRSRPACPSSGSCSTAPRPQRLDVAVADVFSVLQANLGGLYVNDFNLYGKVWKVIIQAEGTRRARPDDIGGLYVLNRKGSKVPLSSLGDVNYTLAPIDVPHYNLYNAAKITGQPAAGYSSGQAIPAMERGRRPRCCPRASPTSGPAPRSRSRRPATSPPVSSPCRSSASSSSWRRFTRAGSARW